MKEKKDNKKLLDQIKELEKKVAELTTGWQRSQADFLNYKKNTELDRQKLIKTANESLICELFPILDNFSLAAKHLPKELGENNWAQGIKQIEKQLENILATEGLEKISCVGTHFNPELHEAIEQIESDKPEGEVVEEVTPGYKLNDSTLRPARVKVSKSK